MIRNGRSGWYYRVIETGVLAAGDRLDVLERPNPTWPMVRFNRVLSSKSSAMEDMVEIATLAGLATSWRETARDAVAHASRKRRTLDDAED